MSNPPEWDRDAGLAGRLVAAAIKLTRTLRAVSRASAYSGPQISALAVILSAGRLLARDLARWEEVTPATISRLVADLEREGLVRREPDEIDTRKQWISATPRGAAVVLEGHARRIAPLMEAAEALSEADKAKLDEGLKIMERLIEAVAARRSESI